MTSVSIVMPKGRAALEQMRITATTQGDAGTTRVALAAPRLDVANGAYEASAMILGLDVKRGGTELNAAMNGALHGGGSGLFVTDVRGDFTLNASRFPHRRVAGTARGDARVDFENPGVHLKLAGDVAGSHIVADVSAAGTAEPVYTFGVNVDKLDLDLYTSTAQPSRKTDAREALLQPLADLPASGTLRIGTLKSGDMRVRDVLIELR